MAVASARVEEVIKRSTWENVHILVDKWPDIDLPHSRVIRKADELGLHAGFLAQPTQTDADPR